MVRLRGGPAKRRLHISRVLNWTALQAVDTMLEPTFFI
jgi:hypothetical protein